MALTNAEHFPASIQATLEDLSQIPTVLAIALGGSSSRNEDDAYSDYDIYVYSEGNPTDKKLVQARAAIARRYTDVMELNNTVWEAGDEWIDRASGKKLDLIYRDRPMLEGQLDRVLVRHEASVGYTTSIWDNVRNSQVLFDRFGWFAEQQARANQPYPEALVQAIIAKNRPLLRDAFGSYFHQIENAARRNDQVSLNHRVAALLASYFDILFALNRQTHPGEKRLMKYARQLCPRLPANFEADLTALLTANPATVVAAANQVLDELEKILN